VIPPMARMQTPSAENDQQDGEQQSAKAQQGEEESEPDSEQALAKQQWLQRIPDDPAGLLRRKFHYQYKKRARTKSGDKAW